MNKLLCTMLSLGVLLSMACSSQPKTPVATPTVPAELTSLPGRAWIHCDQDTKLSGTTVYVWEFPGLAAADPDSAYQGRRGDIVGELPPCTEVRVLSYAWSASDKEYYVLVTPGPIKGWALLHLVQFTEPPLGALRRLRRA